MRFHSDMAKRVGQYRITRPEVDVDLVVDTIMFLIEKGKTNLLKMLI